MTLDELKRSVEDILRDVEAGRLPATYRPFAVASRMFITELTQRLEDGRFQDPLWIRALCLDADQRYLRAVRAPAGDASARPGPWRVAFDVADRGRGGILRHLLLGINAHILYDLVVTVAGRLDPARGEQQRADFARLNDMIGTIVDDVQDALEAGSPLLVAADVSAFRFDEVATWGLFRVVRARAFDDAVRLRDGRIDLRTIERNATAAARALALVPL